jgi:predicted Zn-dependent protease with MMP-like domain
MLEENTPPERHPRSRHRDVQAQAALRRQRFYDVIMKAIDELPDSFRDRLENIDVIVADWPSPSQIARAHTRSRYGLLGLYEGVPHTRRGRGYGFVLPDKITLFRKPIEARCDSWTAVEEEIARVVLHEIAHHFGIDDAKLTELESDRRRKKRPR